MYYYNSTDWFLAGFYFRSNHVAKLASDNVTLTIKEVAISRLRPVMTNGPRIIEEVDKDQIEKSE